MAHRLGLAHGEYGVVTLHRPSNVDVAERLASIVDRLVDIAREIPLVFPVHPRTRQHLNDFGLAGRIEAARGIRLAEPLSYIEFMSLVVDCRFALTDSGGVQEETTRLGVPCVTLRDSTERPITLTLGTNRLAGVDTVITEVRRAMHGPARIHCAVPLWDGATAQRVVASLGRRSSWAH
jgi:UDP-N-acetylglucosamine 2-epimerase (non-hydrolysing)